MVWVQIWEEPSGAQTAEANFYSKPSSDFPEGFWARLAGPNLSGIESYHQARVKLWGTVAGQTGPLPEIEVERIELVAAAPQVQAWLGT